MTADLDPVSVPVPNEWLDLPPHLKAKVLADAKRERLLREAEAAGIVVAEKPNDPTAGGTIITHHLDAVPSVKSGFLTSEIAVALLMPFIAGAVVQLGWLSEESAVALGVSGGTAFVLGRNAIKAVAEWKRRT